MDSFFASPEMQICRSFRDACAGTGSCIIRGSLPTDQVRDFARSAASGLLSAPRRLESRFLYDSHGSDLFERITQQPEYYLTRTETSILATHGGRIRESAGPVNLIELGSGNAIKTDILLAAWLRQGPRACYVPVDVSDSALAVACQRIPSKYPAVRVVAVNAQYHDAFPLFAQLSPSLVLFLGSSIGNLGPVEMGNFLHQLASSLQAGDLFLLGIDLVKDARVIEVAYNDAAGVTACFTRNLFARMNRELGCSLDLDSIQHVALYNREKEQIEVFGHFTRQQTVNLSPLGRQLVIPQGEMVQVEISRKFRLGRFLPYLEEFGFERVEVFTDEREWFALLLLRRRPTYLSGRRGRE